MNNLTETIIAAIKENGTISFKDFMEMALYHPSFGYYSSNCKQFGCKGDYFTSPTLTPLFGEMLSKQITEMWKQLGEKDFTIVEFGAGNGMLCKDILENLGKEKKIYDSINYIIIEKSDALRKKQKSILNKKVQWFENIQSVSNFSGCVLSNELIDNFAVHVVIMKDELMEVHVGYDNEFFEILKPANEELKSYFNEQEVSLPINFRTEANLQAIQWLKEISQSLKQGFILTVDYGCTSQELYASAKRIGSVLCYHRHQISDDPYKNIGEQDITSQVNFSALKYWGNKNDLYCCGYTSQSRFLRAMGIMNKLRELELKKNDDSIQKLRAIFFSMGEKIKLMIHQKGLRRPFLSGMQFPLPI